MRRALLLFLVVFAVSGFVTSRSIIYSQTIEYVYGVAYIHNTSEGKWETPRIDLTFLKMFGDEDNDNYIFYEPKAIVADNAGNIYVLDSKNHRVQVFNKDLDLYTTINTDLDVDSKGRIWVVTYTRNLKIIDDKVFILDQDRLMQFYVYQINERGR